MDKQVFNLTIFLIKDYIEEFDECLKSPDNLEVKPVQDQFGFEGNIYYCSSSSKPPRWKNYLENLAGSSIEIGDNSSNKALLLAKIDTRILAIVFGYGRSFIKEECIERNFGFKVALNVINPSKMRSVNAATIEDMVVTTQRQASYSTVQEEFGLNITNDIMRGITGTPYDTRYGKQISGKDSLVVSVLMELSELREKLTLYIDAYSMKRYKEIGFDWVDNVGEVRDSILSDALDGELVSAIREHKLDHLHLAPPETTDWEQVVGFCCSGMGKNTSEADNYSIDLDLAEYIDKLKPSINIYLKIKRDRLYAMTEEENPFAICSIYDALVFQTVYKDKTYILCSGNWYCVETSFFDNVHRFVRERIPISTIVLPDCPAGVGEGEYNKMAVTGNSDFCLMDKKVIAVENGPKRVEACDIFTKGKEFIHVKKRDKSSQLSHLFSQGRVSAQCFMSDEFFRKQVSEIAEKEFSEQIFDYTCKPSSNEYEVIYAIIHNKSNSINEILPFFSLVNLMLAAQELDRMHFKYSVCLVKRQ